MSEQDFLMLREQYPEGMNKEQFYKLCHISKRTAQRLLESGRVPCQRREQRTHRYAISIDDVIIYLIQREIAPERFAFVKKFDATIYHMEKLPIHYEAHLMALYQSRMEQLPDTLTVRDIIKVTGYSVKTIRKWCHNGVIHCFQMKHAYMIPKDCLLAFMMSARFRKIGTKSDYHRRLIEDLTQDQ